MRKLTTILILILVASMSCDTKLNIEPNFESHFVKYYGGKGNQEGREDDGPAQGNAASHPSTWAGDTIGVQEEEEQECFDDFTGVVGDVMLITADARFAEQFRKVKRKKWDDGVKEMEVALRGE